MIREQDLRDAIAECQGERNPNANTCIKLAAYYTILDHISEVDTPQPMGYSYSGAYDSGSEFSEAIKGKESSEIYAVMDELMSTVEMLIPKLYFATIRKLKSEV